MKPCLFRPDALRAAELDRRVRQALADSLASVFEAAQGYLSASCAAQTRLLTAVRSHPITPGAFAMYAELVEALHAEERISAQRLLDMMLRPAMAEPSIARVVTLDEASLGEGIPDLYARAVDDDPGVRIRLAAVGAEELARGRALCHAAADLLHAAAPDLEGEIEHVAHQLVLVRDAFLDGGSAAFDGAATFYLWGAVVLNITRQTTRTQLATALAHEAGHAYLLGTMLGAPLVDNDPSERFRSPLRSDPRPMDGLVHASFVLARMLWCQDRMLDCGLLEAAEEREVRAARAVNHRLFVDSAGLIASQACFRPEGGKLWQAAQEWVANGCPPN